MGWPLKGGMAFPAEDMAYILDRTAGIWEGARGARFFITGGTGFFGKWLLRSFCHANDALGLGMSAVVLTRSDAISERPDVSFIRGDVRDFAFPDGRFDYVIHAAMDAGPSFASMEDCKASETIAGGSKRVLEFSRGAGVKRLLFVSSGAVYSGTSAYAQAKRDAERRLLGFSGASVARCFTFIGPGMPLDAHYAAGNFLRDAMAGGPVRVHGDGSSVRSYMYAADLAVWLWTILFRGKSGSAYDVGSDQPVSIAEVAGMVADRAGCGLIIEKAFTQTSRYVPSIQAENTELGLSPGIALPDAIDRTLRWLG